jgi:hypothetical protein
VNSEALVRGKKSQKKKKTLKRKTTKAARCEQVGWSDAMIVPCESMREEKKKKKSQRNNDETLVHLNMKPSISERQRERKCSMSKSQNLKGQNI